MNKEKTGKRLYAGILVALAAVLAIRAFYGFCWSDESFYLTFAQRLWHGQRLILDEWHPVQFYSVIFYPVLSCYRWLFGREGIYLFARFLYLALALGTSELVFYTFSRRYPMFASFLCAASVLAYSRGNIWGLSYYNLFLLFSLAALCLAVLGKEKKLLPTISGLCLGFAVLCVPYFAIFVLLVLAIEIWKPDTRKQALWIILGICLGAAYFLLFFLPKDIGAVMQNLREILSDPEHASGPAANFMLAVQDVKLIYGRDVFLALFCAAYLWVVRKWMPQYKAAQLPGLLLAFAGAVYSFWRCRRGETGFAAYSYCIYCLALFRWDTSDTLDLMLRRLGAAMAVSMAMSSNTEAIVFTVGLCVYAMGLMLPLSREKQWTRLTSAALACIMVGMTFSSRLTTVFRDGPMETLTVSMTQGPAKGIRTTQESAEQYDQILAMLDDLEEKYGEENPIFFTKILPWGYLACDYPCGAPTAWRTELSSARLQGYYESHPDFIPKLVVVLNSEIGKNPDLDAPNENTLTGWLWDYMEKNNYSCLEYPCANVYAAPNNH